MNLISQEVYQDFHFLDVQSFRGHKFLFFSLKLNFLEIFFPCFPLKLKIRGRIQTTFLITIK
jgi:hypothetical protein